MNNKKPHITVIGSSNTDMVVKTKALPKPGETLLGGLFFMNPGGKGANQAVAAARIGGDVCLIARVGNDVFGKQARQLLEKEGINISRIFTDPEYPSGVALINVDEKGENCIAVAPGANDFLSVKDVDASLSEVLDAELILLQLEIPTETVSHAINLAYKAGKKVILNPAPARILTDEDLSMIYLITPNETEAMFLTGIRVTDESSAGEAARALISKGVKNVIITMGSQGAYVNTGNDGRLIAAPKVKAVDSTAAGDVFNGVLGVFLAENRDLYEAVALANKAAAISVTRMGAQASAPFRHEVVSSDIKL